MFDDFCADYLQLLLVATDDYDLSAQCRQLMRGAATDATATTGDDHGLTVKQSRPEYRSISHAAFSLLDFGFAACPARARATIIFMIPAVPSPISTPITSRIRCRWCR